MCLKQVFGRGKPCGGQPTVFRLASQEVEKVDAQTTNHQHLQVKTVPVCSQVEWNLYTQQTNFSFKKKVFKRSLLKA
jgi:hypothetical protein